MTQTKDHDNKVKCHVATRQTWTFIISASMLLALCTKTKEERMWLMCCKSCD
jgi:hypothetical protein